MVSPLSWAALIAVAVLLVTGGTVIAKGPPDKVTLRGPGLNAEVEVTAPATLRAMDMLGSLIEERQSTHLPADAGPGYQVTSYFNNGYSFRPFDRWRYYPSLNGGAGYVFYVGLVNGWSEFDGRWFYAPPELERVVLKVLADHGIWVLHGATLVSCFGPIRWRPVCVD